MINHAIILCTVPDKKSGKLIAQSLLEQKLCACVNIIPAVTSMYWWQGDIEEAEELMLFIKTVSANYSNIEREIKSLHPYDNPEIIMLPIEAGSFDYLAWIASSLDKTS